MSGARKLWLSVPAALLPLCLVAAWFALRRRGPRASGALPHEVYVWQRVWGTTVREAVEEADSKVSGVVALGAEVSWKEGLRAVRVELDHDALRATRLPLGLALRIGPFSGTREAFVERAPFLAELAASLVSEAQTAGVPATELQIDFDCPESKLDRFRLWVEAVKDACAPVPVTITALPCWLDRRAFRHLAAAADGYVLQVHSLERPSEPDASLPLCDPGKASKWIERAARIGRPFRVALPTYGYLVGFASEGTFLGLSAEGPASVWPVGARVHEVRADPVALADFVSELIRDRPAALQGVIWYRLPTSEDRLNWRWPTLAAVMDGRSPGVELRARVRQSQPCLADVELINVGEVEPSGGVAVSARWRRGRLLACDAVNGFVLARVAPGEVTFARASRGPDGIAPGERRLVGWLRFERDVEVEVDVATLDG